MALFYTDYDSLDNKPRREWHVGEPVPRLQRVVTFQADGHELRMIQQAMRLAYVKGSGVEFAKHDYSDID